MTRVAFVEQLLAQIDYRKWSFHVNPLPESGCFLQVRFDAPNGGQKGRKWYISPHATRSEIIQTAFLAVSTAEEHERREDFLFNGEAIFGPHFDVERLHGLAAQHAFEVRAPAPV